VDVEKQMMVDAEVVAVVDWSELNETVGVVKDASSAFSSSGVVRVGEEDEVVIATVEIPIRLVVTTVSMRGERAVSESMGSDGVDAPPVDSCLSIFAGFSAGAEDEPPRHGKQQRNSVERSGNPQFQFYSRLSASSVSCARLYD
jgi:hypothetical protein